MGEPQPFHCGTSPRIDWTPLSSVPNLLSLARIVLVPVAALIYLYGFRMTGFLLGAVAGFTDLVDGWLARKLHQESEIGAVLDRLGDLVLESSALVVLTMLGFIGPWILIAYQFREFVVLSIRQMGARRGLEIKSNWFGKLKTHGLCIGSGLVVIPHAGFVTAPDVASAFESIGIWLILIGLVFSYLSGVQYTLMSASRFKP